jgi:hypothetical protein
MKKVFFLSIFFLFCVVIFSFTNQTPQKTTTNNVVVQFVSVNGYGNNLFVDNVIIGSQFQYDVAVNGLTNIPKDTSYTTNGNTNFSIAPVANISNIGTGTATSFTVTMTSTAPSGYTSTKTVSSLAPGTSTDVTFDNLSVTIGTGMNFKVYSNWSLDQNRTNDTSKQYSIYLGGTKRNVLFEAFTQWNCGPCASQNPILDALVDSKWDSICAVKHHVWWPGANNDPMYLANVTQNNYRINQYHVNAVPTCVVDGVITQVSGYSVMTNHYNTRRAKGTPVGVTVVDTRIAGDTIKADVSVNIISQLPAGAYRLRLDAIERRRNYTGGSNGETTFKDIFRYMYPDTSGISLPTAPGTYNYTIKYKRDANWIDSLVFSTAIVQNNYTLEVLNCAKARHYTGDIANNTNIKSSGNDKPLLRPELMNTPYIPLRMFGGSTDGIMSGFNFEGFETSFPPAGWTIKNPDGGITFAQYSGVNGPSMTGTKTSYINFYAYSTTGQKDTMVTKVYNNVDPGDTLKFDWAHAMYSGYVDRLIVQVSIDGGLTWPYTIFNRSSTDSLPTAPATTSEFFPSGASQWRTFKKAFGSIVTGINNNTNIIPNNYALYQNYPNPFNPVTNINYDIPKTGLVKIAVYDLTGKEVAVLVNDLIIAGSHQVTFDASALASGVYFYKLITENYSETKKLMLVK